MRLKIMLLVTCLLSGMAAMAVPDSVNLNYRIINNYPVKYVMVNMRDPDVLVTTAVARAFPNGVESWNSFMTRLRPDAAINGSYFSVSGRYPLGDLAMDGVLLHRGSTGTSLCITPDNRVALLPGAQHANHTRQGFRTVLTAGPRLLTEGKQTLQPRAEGFRDPRVLGSAPRSAVAIRGDGRLVLLTVEKNISLASLAQVTRQLGATDAMVLDGGSSSGLYINGRTVTRPGRSISNILAVYTTPARYQAVAKQYATDRLPAAGRLLKPAALSDPEEAKTLPSAAPDSAEPSQDMITEREHSDVTIAEK